MDFGQVNLEKNLEFYDDLTASFFNAEVFSNVVDLKKLER
jgi:hypothetical protein